MSLTPADVRNKQFTTTRMRPGYDQDEVDAFLEEVEAELDRLVQENEGLQARLRESLGSRQLSPMAPDPWSGVPDASVPEPSRPPGPESPPQPGRDTQPAEPPLEAAARVLVLAQQSADQAISDARRDADETISVARREADDLVSQAQQRAEEITSEARARAESLERDAHARQQRAMGSLVQQREELERQIDDLQGCRDRLKAHLSAVLQGLEGDGDGSPIRPGGPEAPVGAAPIGEPAASPNGAKLPT